MGRFNANRATSVGRIHWGASASVPTVIEGGPTVCARAIGATMHVSSTVATVSGAGDDGLRVTPPGKAAFVPGGPGGGAARATRAQLTLPSALSLVGRLADAVVWQAICRRRESRQSQA
jgi:hypothetical protein